jgi:hypothetical protein
MRKLEHSHDVHAERPGERPFHKRLSRKLLEAARTVALGTAIAMGTAIAVAPVLTPNIAMAQDENRDVGGRTVRVLRLDRSLADLDRDTSRYRDPSHEHMPGQQNNYVYSNDIVIPNEVTFVVSLDRANNSRWIYVRFPANRETNPNTPSPGLRAFDLNDFNSYVNSLSGQDFTRVKFIIETGTFQYNGRETKYTNLYLFPLDSSGNILTRRGNGEFIEFDVSYYADRAIGGISLLIEPNNRDTIARNP